MRFGIYFDENILIFLENSYICRLLKTLGDNFRSPQYLKKNRQLISKSVPIC